MANGRSFQPDSDARLAVLALTVAVVAAGFATDEEAAEALGVDATVWSAYYVEVITMSVEGLQRLRRIRMGQD